MQDREGSGRARRRQTTPSRPIRRSSRLPRSCRGPRQIAARPTSRAVRRKNSGGRRAEGERLGRSNQCASSAADLARPTLFRPPCSRSLAPSRSTSLLPPSPLHRLWPSSAELPPPPGCPLPLPRRRNERSSCERERRALTRKRGIDCPKRRMPAPATPPQPARVAVHLEAFLRERAHEHRDEGRGRWERTLTPCCQAQAGARARARANQQGRKERVGARNEPFGCVESAGFKGDTHVQGPVGDGSNWTRLVARRTRETSIAKREGRGRAGG